jgi:hypothetical protein
MDANRTGRQVREQIARFSGIFTPRFSKPKGRFIEQMLFGLAAAGDVKLSAIGRALGEGIALKKTEERLGHHLDEAGLGQGINEGLAAAAAGRVRADTLVVVDISDVQKPYAQAMPYLAQVRDGDTGQIGRGYWTCVAVACERGSRRVIPLHQRLWSAAAPDFVSENTQLLEVLATIRRATQGRGIYVLDRGGDRGELFNPLLDGKLRFIVRLKGDRAVLFAGRARLADEVAASCPMRFAETVIKEEHGEEKRYQLEYGFRTVRLPDRPEPLALVVVRGFGPRPLMLLTNVTVLPSRRSLWAIVEGYLTRWLVEETIRFIKQSYRLEDMRVLSYERLRNLVALVMAAVYFTAVWLGASLKLAVLSTRVAQVAKRFFGVPDFHYYALADGLATVLARLGCWRPHPRDSSATSAQLPLFSLE